MTKDTEAKILREIEALKKQIGIKEKEELVTYTFSKITNKLLDELFTLEKSYDKSVFDAWFNNDVVINDAAIAFLTSLLAEEEDFLRDYNEEDLKINFISPILRHVNFKIRDKKIRAFYEESLSYRTEQFILTGTPDFFVSKGLEKPKMPFFFIQEFKRSQEYGNPKPQLLAELISAIELNNWNSIKGAYIKGAIWVFVILVKIEHSEYQYTESQNFDSSKIDDLKAIYQNLCFVKNEILNFPE